MANQKKLAKRVNVAGTWYEPGDEVPEEIAARITNPKAWAADDAANAGGADGGGAAKKSGKPGTPSGARLARSVHVAGASYGPDDEVPADIAARITNPKAWENGKLPAEVRSAQRVKASGSEQPADGSGRAAPEGSGGPGPAGPDAGGEGGDQPPAPSVKPAKAAGARATRAS